MKKLILILCIGLLLNSCSSDNNSNNPASTDVLLVKTITDDDGDITFFNYNGNKLASITNSTNDIFQTFTYNGNLLIKQELQSPDPNIVVTSFNFNYSNNILTSQTIYYDNFLNNTFTYTYNPDGSVTELSDYSMWKRYYSQGNCIKEEYYTTNFNNVMTLYSTKTITYDNKNSCFKSQAEWQGTLNWGPSSLINNEIGSITKNASGVTTRVTNTVYEYNSQDYPINAVQTSTPYTPLPGTNSSFPGSSTITTENFTYF